MNLVGNQVDTETIARIKKFRRMKFSVAGIARQCGVTEADVAKVLQEPHLLAQASRAVGKR